MKRLTPKQAEELRLCKENPQYFITTYCKTYDPRPEGAPHHLPFELYEFQHSYISWLEARLQASEDAVTEKSRDMGASWCTFAWLLWHWRFDDAFQSLIGSRKEDLVDNWEIDSHFGRLEYMVEHLPDWLRPQGWVLREHRHYMKLNNPENGNAIIGESANRNFARQGRYTVIVLDEFAFWEWAEQVLTGTADATTCRVITSTPNGANSFKRLRFSGRVKVKTLHWKLHPHKNDAWYKGECARRTPEEIAQELDISYEKSVRGRVYPEWADVVKGEYPYQPGWPLYVSWDFGLDDNTAMIWWQRNPANGLFRIVDCYSNSGSTIDFYAPLVTGRITSGVPYQYTENDLAAIEAHRGWPGAVHYGDPAGSQRNQVTGTSVIAALREHGIHVQTKPDMNRFEERWQQAKLFLRRLEGVNMPACGALDDALVNARFPERLEQSQATTEISKPIHDWTSHYRTAVEYMAVNASSVSSYGTQRPAYVGVARG